MPRKPLANTEDRLTHSIIIRISESLFKRLEKLRKESRSPSIAEVCRNILNNQKIRLFQQDATMNPAMEELALIRKELKSIGININQVTHRFHGTTNENAKIHYALKNGELYQSVGTKVDSLLLIVSKLAERWLQE